MRISINLANRPFVELRPLFAKLRLAMAFLAVLAVALGFWLHSLNAKASVARAKMDALQAKTQEYQHERMVNEARMRQPQNMAVLDRSRYLNTLFAEKSFSWTAVMMDLEKVLPPGVQVTSIEPQITKEGDVIIRLRVSGDRERAVQLVRNLETSQRFLSPRPASEQSQTQEGAVRGANVPVLPPGSVQFEIWSGYNPLPAKTVKTAAKDEDQNKSEDQNSDSSEAAKKRKNPKPPVPPRRSAVVKAPMQKGAPR
ncbi:MAG: PilN domain-containing protein [Edaphobacter sp.]